MEPSGRQVHSLQAFGSRRQLLGGPKGPRLHRLDEVLKEEGVSIRSAAARMGVAVADAREEACPSFDFALSALYRWQEALSVPVADLLTPPSLRLSTAIEMRARLLKAMRTVRSIQLHVDDEKAQALAIMLAQQLMEIMPELNAVSAWPTVGNRRTQDELGAIVDRSVPDALFEGGEL